MPGFNGNGPSAGVLAAQLAANIERVAESVLSDCKREGSELRGRAPDGMLWVIETRGGKRGLCLCAADPDRSGDPLTFIAEALHAGNRKAAYAWARNWTGNTAELVRPPAADRALSAAEQAERTEKRRRSAWAKFINAEKQLAGSPVEDYLSGRGLPASLVPLSRALRFEPRCYYSGGEGRPDVYLPAMVAAIIEPTSRQFRAVHCTYLAYRDGQWRKARLDPPRKCWGPVKGGVVALRRGASGKDLCHAPDDDGCLIAEGIENALSASVMRPELRAFAGISVGNLAAIRFPDSMASIGLVQDRDGENTGVAAAYERATNRWLREGRGVEMLRPPGGHADFNIWLQAIVQQAGAEA